MDLMKKKETIYIFPTRMGGYFNGLLFLMFLLSIGYSNNLLLIFTLFLFGFNLIWVIQTHFYLHALKRENIKIGHGHSGGPAAFNIQWRSLPSGFQDWDLSVVCKHEIVPVKILENRENVTLGEIVVNRRGLWEWNYLLISSRRPYGLYRAWRYQRISHSSYAYPALSQEAPPPLLTYSTGEGEHLTGRNGSGDFYSLSSYAGEAMRMISWKHYARTGEVLVKEGEHQSDPLAQFSLFEIQGGRKEIELSIMATQMVNCHRENIPFELRTPHKHLGPAAHQQHLHECLKELALW
jgi:uncharacterized protein (DUF58 family)